MNRGFHVGDERECVVGAAAILEDPNHLHADSLECGMSREEVLRSVIAAVDRIELRAQPCVRASRDERVQEDLGRPIERYRDEHRPGPHRLTVFVVLVLALVVAVG